MGHVSRPKIILVVLCFVITSILIYRGAGVNAAHKQTSLLGALADIKGWRSSELIRLDRKIIDALHLDEYVNYNFSNGAETVSLYIGYYLTSKKVSAAHSPLVCFPGQGWVLSDSSEKTLRIGPDKINLKLMVATIGQRKELLIYWFQAYDKTSPGTFLQKINTLWAKFLKGREDNAFVRVTVPMNGESIDKPYRTGVKFIESFYPRFLEYVKENQS